MSLILHLQQIRDFRTQPRYPLWVVLLLVIMGTMSDCLGYRALEDFVERHQKVLLELMELPHKRLPSYSTIRRVMVRIDFLALTEAFNAWANEAFAYHTKSGCQSQLIIKKRLYGARDAKESTFSKPL